MKTYKLYNKQVKVNGDLFTHHLVGDIELTEKEVKELVNEYMMTNGGATPTHKRKYFVPKVGEKYYLVSGDDYRAIICYTNNEHGADINNIKQGNCFATEQEAQDELNRRQALVRLWSNYDDKYSWDIDWEDNDPTKYYIGYDYSIKSVFADCYSHSIKTNTELPYFKSAEDRNQFVESNRDDLLIIFNIKK